MCICVCTDTCTTSEAIFFTVVETLNHWGSPLESFFFFLGLICARGTLFKCNQLSFSTPPIPPHNTFVRQIRLRNYFFFTLYQILWCCFKQGYAKNRRRLERWILDRETSLLKETAITIIGGYSSRFREMKNISKYIA